MIRSGLR